MTIDELVPGQILRNDEIVSIFQCAPQGGMRRSKRTNSLVLISDHTKALYEDRWEGDVFHYTGMGRVGDQKLDFQQNKTLAESTTNGVDLYLFEVFRENEYVFMGQVELADQPYQDQQLDIENNLRLVWIFPLKLKENTQPIEIPQEWIESKNRYREKIAKKLSDEELKARAKHTNKKLLSVQRVQLHMSETLMSVNMPRDGQMAFVSFVISQHHLMIRMETPI